jgi:NADH dehydrogenase
MSNLVTGSFSFSGRYITLELLKTGERIETLTNHPKSNYSYYSKITIKPYRFDDFKALVDNFRGVDTFYNSYWIRYPHGSTSWNDAIKNSHKLFKACKLAGVKKIVHISVTNPTIDSPYSYFKGKAIVEELLKRSGVPYTILRIAWMFEAGDILVNNIAWILRRFPIFGVFGDGKYKLQPVSLKTLGRVAVENRYLGNHTKNINKTIDVIGPETYTYLEFVTIINKTLKTKTLIIPFPGITEYIPILVSKFLNFFLQDRILTLDEIGSLKDNLLFTNSPKIGFKSFNKWLQKNKLQLGRHWSNEIKRHYY